MTTTEAPPDGGRCVEILRLLDELETALVERKEFTQGQFSAIGALLTDALLDSDDESLYHCIRKLQRIYGRIIRSNSCVEERGRVLALIDVVHWARRYIIPKTVLAELTLESLPRQVLEVLQSHPRRDVPALDLAREAARRGFGGDSLRSVMSSLAGMGMVTTRRTGNTAYWSITPRGSQALHLSRP